MDYGHINGLDKDISRLVQGTMMLNPDEKQANFELLDAVFEYGCNTFDCGHIYGGGACERVLGEWIEKRGLREQTVILDKGCHHNTDRKRITPFDLEADLHDSLARLRTDCIDIYVLHRDDPSVEVGPIVDILNMYAEAGVIRLFGGSNWSHKRITEANEYAERHGLRPFSVSSPNFSLAEQIESPWSDDCVSIAGPENEEARQWYRNHDFALFTWSSLARGFFSGLYTRENFEELRNTSDSSSIRAYCYEDNFRRLSRVQKLAEKKGVTIPQIAMAYVMNTPLNIFALIGCYTPGEFRECLEAASIDLTPDEMAWLDLQNEKNSGSPV